MGRPKRRPMYWGLDFPSIQRTPPMEEEARGSTTAKRRKPIPPKEKTIKKKKKKRDPLSDCTNVPPSQSSTSPAAPSPIPKPPAGRPEGSADDVATTGSVYTRRKNGSRRSASLVPRLAENGGGTLFKYSTEEDAHPPSMSSKSLTEPSRKKRRHQGSSEKLAQDFIQKQKAYFAEIDAFELPVEVASSDELD